MYSLFTFDPGQWLSNGLEKVAGAALQVFRTICYFLDTIIYKLVIDLYNLFETLCTSRILSTGDFAELSKRIGFILGMIMLFRVIFSFIQMLIDPDTATDKDKGAVSIIKKCIIVIIMLGISSFLFDTLHSFQNTVIKNHIISRLLLPKVVDTDNFGAMLSEEVLTSFYILNEDTQGELLYDHCSNYINGLKNQIVTENKFDYGYNCLNETIVKNLDSESTESQEFFIIEFNPISVLVGIALVWLLFRYCVSVGVRVIQLTILEIVSPMPIIAYLSPKKDSIFDKWKNMYISTYIDVFIRIAIINFVVYICANILDYWESGSGEFWTSVGSPTDAHTKGFIAVVMILALLTFAKKAPELIKELLPTSASKIGFGAGMKDVVGLKKGVGIGTSILGGAAGGAAIGLLGGGLGGFTGGLLKGGFSGIKGQGIGKTATSAWKNQVASNKRISDWKNAGGTSTFGRWGAAFNQWRGADTAADKFDLEKTRLEAENSAYKSFDSYLDAAEKRAEGQILKGKFSGNSHAQEALKQKNLTEIYRQQSATIKRSDFRTDTDYDNALSALANKASVAESNYLNEMKSAKKDYISSVLNGSESDAPTLQNLQQAAGVVAANKGERYSAFENVTEASLLRGNYDSFDTVNGNAKTQQTKNNNELARNAKAGEAARANAKYSGRKG